MKYLLKIVHLLSIHNPFNVFCLQIVGGEYKIASLHEVKLELKHSNILHAIKYSCLAKFKKLHWGSGRSSPKSSTIFNFSPLFNEKSKSSFKLIGTIPFCVYSLLVIIESSMKTIIITQKKRAKGLISYRDKATKKDNKKFNKHFT